MSSRPVVELAGVGKEYVLGERAGISSLRDVFSGRRRGEQEPPRWRRDRIWALRDTSFDIARGEAVGIIGHNGAGKTTLLKLLSRITAPTTGEIRITGHVGSLLEVGTGFHPELTGRDNVFLNGAILGMRRREILSKFDEIVEFAGIARFIDTPVKRYSSGMYVRLAFAVAAHLDPDILVVDEVLAVGDAAFQRKCLGNLGAARQQGRTVVFVSHNMAAIRSLTSRAVWLDHGTVAADGPTVDVVSEYLSAVAGADTDAIADLRDDRSRRANSKPTAQRARFESVAIVTTEGLPTARVTQGGPIRVATTFRVGEPLRFLELHCRVKTGDGVRLFSSFSGQHDGLVEPGLYRAVCEFPVNSLIPGLYNLELVAKSTENEDIVPDALEFEVESGATVEEDFRYGRASGVFRVDSRWSEFEPVAETAPLGETAAVVTKPSY